MIREQDGPNSVGAIVSLLGLTDCEGATNPTEALFLLTKHLVQEYQLPTEGEERLFLNIVSLDGQFGQTGNIGPEQEISGTFGLTKSVRHEISYVHCVSVDVSTDLSPSARLATILDSILNPPQQRELGFNSDGCWTIAMQPITTGAGEAEPQITTLDANSVVVVTGGAQGVTAGTTMGIARTGCKLILLGRTPRATEADLPYLSHDEMQLRKRLIQEAGKGVIPQKIQQQVNQYLKQAQIESTLVEFERLGAHVEYITCDVSDPKRMPDVIDDIYTRYGRIDGVVHGAGVIRDKLMEQKTLEHFQLVYKAKVESARILANTLKPDGLKFFIFFSSVASRFGNRGQTDYSAANEYLNTLAYHLDKKWPARVCALMWGPWDGGMVNDALRSMFAKYEIGLISITEGTRVLADVINTPNSSQSGILVSKSVENLQRLGNLIP